MSISYIENLCKRYNQEDLPALGQLRRAYEINDKESIKRITENILFFFSKRNKITIPNLKRMDV